MESNKSLAAMAIVFVLGLAFQATISAFAQDSSATSDSIDNLVADVKAHHVACANITPAQSAIFSRCQHEQNVLIERQQRLGISDEALNSKLETRRWHWP
jgi:uncharacterized protein YfiM (DUF2279 family)